MFLKVHIRFIISGHISDNRYKKPSASYLEQGSTKRKSPYYQTPDFPIPTIFWAYLGLFEEYISQKQGKKNNQML